MKPTFIAYIDESGDEGFRFHKQGTPDWFALSAAIVRKTDDLDMVQMMKSVKQELGKPIKKPLHFKDLRHEQRVASSRRSNVPSTGSMRIAMPACSSQWCIGTTDAIMATG